MAKINAPGFKTYASFNKRNVEKYLKLMEKKFKHLHNRPWWVKAASDIVYKDVIRHFEQEKGPDGARWTRWMTSYRKQLQRQGKAGNQILQDNGDLRKNFRPTNTRRRKKSIVWYNNAKTEKNFPYAYAHDNDETPRTKLARRSFMWLSDNAMDQIVDKSLKYFIDTRKK
jgi:phage gpG-like protein